MYPGVTRQQLCCCVHAGSQVVWLLRAGAPSCSEGVLSAVPPAVSFKVYGQSFLQSISRCIHSPSCSQYSKGASESQQLSVANHHVFGLVTGGVSTAAVSLWLPYAADDGMGYAPPILAPGVSAGRLGTPRITGDVSSQLI